MDSGANRSGEVDSGVVAGPGSDLAEPGGDGVAASHRQAGRATARRVTGEGKQPLRLPPLPLFADRLAAMRTACF